MQTLRDSITRYGRDTFSSLAVPNYRLYYIGQIISTSGTWMQSIAQAWLVLKLTGSGTALGITGALQYLPILVLGPYGGVIADRLPKRTILYVTQSLAGILALILGTLVWTGAVRVWMVYILAFCLGIVTTFDNPARQSFLIELVGPGQLRNAVTLYSTLVNLTRVIGPAVAAAVIAAAGLAPCFIINGLSYFPVVVTLWAMRTSELLPSPPAPRARGQIREGFQYVLRTPILASTLLAMAVIGTLTFEFQVSLPLIAQFTFKGDASSYALLTSSLGIGATAGGIWFASRQTVAHRQLVIATGLFGFTVLLAALMPSLSLTALVMFLVGIASINFTTLGNTILQLESSPQMRGRVMSFWAIAFLGSTTVGAPIVGWFGQTIGPRWALALGGIAGLVATLLAAVTAPAMKQPPADTRGQD